MGGIEVRKENAVCFTGHREIREPISEVEQRLTETVESLIRQGYIFFWAGGARGFDTIASEVVIKLKDVYPQISLFLALPFDEQYTHEKNWTQEDIEQYRKLKELASNVVILSGECRPGVYHRRNRYLVDNSSVCVAYLDDANSGTGYTVDYAKRRGLQVVNICTTYHATDT